MKIAMFTDSYRPQINGVVTSIDAFARELERRGHEVIIFAPASPNYKDKGKNVRRIKSIEFSNYKGYRIGLPIGLMINPKLSDVDMIHVHSPFPVGITGMMISRQYGIPCVATFHTLYSEYSHYLVKNPRITNSKNFKKLFSRLSWSYVRWFYNGTDLIIAPSKQIRNVMRKKGVKKGIEIIPTGVKFSHLNKSRKELRKKHGFGSEKIILHVGRITKEKNIDFIMRALAASLKAGGRRFVIASDGPHKAQLEKLAKDLGIKNIVFTGYLSDDVLQEYYAMSDVFVMASRTETQGIVLLEAAKYCLPSVILDAPVISDFIRENGSGIISSRHAFSRDVGKLLSDSKLQKKLIKNCRKVKERYSIERCTGMLLKAYEKAIASSS